MSNLLQETIETIKAYDRDSSQVEWCGSEKFGWFTWEEFAEVANFEYKSGYGAAHVAKDLVIVGNDFWLSRGEYDGSEWWDFQSRPTKPEHHKIPTTLGGNSYLWDDLEFMNKED